MFVPARMRVNEREGRREGGREREREGELVGFSIAIPKMHDSIVDG